jgi:hypothetical protein
MDENYCGGGGMSKWIRPPNWALFNASCKIHDEAYSLGGTKDDKLTADLGFAWRMLSDINKLEDYNQKRRAVLNAILFYIAVRLFGSHYYNFK